MVPGKKNTQKSKNYSTTHVKCKVHTIPVNSKRNHFCNRLLRKTQTMYSCPEANCKYKFAGQRIKCPKASPQTGNWTLWLQRCSWNRNPFRKQTLQCEAAEQIDFMVLNKNLILNFTWAHMIFTCETHVL